MIATALLPDRIRIDPFLGSDGEGAPVYGTPVLNVPARMYEVRRQVRSSTGVDVVSVQLCQVRPGLGIVAESLVTLDGESWEVSSIEHARELKRHHHDDLVLDGPREPIVAVPGVEGVEDVILDGGAP